MPSASSEQQRQREQQQRRGHEPVERVLERELPALRVEPARREQRQPADVLDAQALGDPLEEAGHERDGDAELLAALDLAQQHLARRGREGDDQVLDPVLLDQPLQVPAGAEHGYRQALLLERLLVEEADGLQAELGVLEQPRGRQTADVAGAHDQRGPQRLAVPARRKLCPVVGDAAGRQVDGAEGEQPQRLRGEVVHVAREQDPKAENAHRREGDHGQHRADVVERRDMEAPRVRPTEVEKAQHQRAVHERPRRRDVDDTGSGGSQLGRGDGRRDHHRVEGERSARPGAVCASPPERPRLLVARLEPSKPLHIQRPGRHYVRPPHPVRRYLRARPSLTSVVPATSSTTPPAASNARSRPVKGRPPLGLTAWEASACSTAPLKPTRG